MAAELAAVSGWRLSDVVTAVAAAGAPVAGRALLSESRAAKPCPVDLTGTVLLGLGLVALLDD